MKMMVGLGNPGEEHKDTRHNTGFLVLDKTAEFQSTNWRTKFNSKIAEKIISGETILLIKPQTYMNKSGEAIRKIADYYNLIKGKTSNNLIVVHDELDLPMGQFKIQQNIGPAGHNGVQSIIDHLGTQDFIRLRIGVKAPHCDISTGAKAKDYLLSNFTESDRKIINPIVSQAAEALIEIIKHTAERAMNKYN